MTIEKEVLDANCAPPILPGDESEKGLLGAISTSLLCIRGTSSTAANGNLDVMLMFKSLLTERNVGCTSGLISTP